MPNSFGSWGAKLSDIADAVWTRATRQLSDVENVKGAIADSVWTRSVRDITNVTAIRDAVWAATTRTLTAGVDLSSAAISDIWSATTRTLTEAVDILQSAADRVWSSTTRTLTAEKVLEAYASETDRSSALTQRSTTSTTPDKLKGARVVFNGVYRIKFDMYSGNSSYYAYAQIYKNGVAVGTQRSTKSGSAVTYSEDLAFGAGDEIEIYAWIQSGNSNMYLLNFKVCADYQTVDIPSLHPYITQD